jgi:predicted Rossmann-fold nucleotide-binding protein
LIVGLLGYGLNPPEEHLSLAIEFGSWLGKQGGTIVCGGFQGTLAAGISACIQNGGFARIILEKDRVLQVPSEWQSFVQPEDDSSMKHQHIAENVSAVIAIGGGPGSLKLMQKAVSSGKKAFIVEGLVDTYDELSELEVFPLASIIQQLNNGLNN